MQIEITGRHVEITEPIKNYIHNRLKKFGKLFIEPIDIHVILGVEKHRQSAELILKSKLFNLTSIEESTDMYNSVNRAIEKIERRALKQKAKVINNKRQHSASDSTLKMSEPAGAGDNDSDRSQVIVEGLARKKPMGVEEALIDLSESDHNFIVFRDSDSDGVRVLYRRRDGNFGLIRPD